jgi:N-acetylglucosamine kinase-like BadF-type ATPase
MILIADIGSTKGDWRIINNGKVSKFTTIGFNPLHDLSMPFLNSLKKMAATRKAFKKIKSIHYYGAGIIDHHQAEIVKNILKEVFRSSEIQVNSDIMAAVRSTCHNKAGVVAILGTGSNSCQFDGDRICDQIPSLGYPLGDEGSGSDMAKQLIRAYFYKEMSPKLENDFKKVFKMSRATFLTSLKSTESPSKLIAKYVKFIVAHRNHKLIKSIVKERLEEFFNRHLIKYELAENEPVHFVGSIAYLFSSEIKRLAKANQMKIGKIHQYPIDELVSYYKK